MDKNEWNSTVKSQQNLRVRLIGSISISVWIIVFGFNNYVIYLTMKRQNYFIYVYLFCQYDLKLTNSLNLTCKLLLYSIYIISRS